MRSVVLAFALLAAATSCGGGSSSGDGSGGAGSGGALGSGGKPGTGGAQGSGGKPGTGGAQGTGGKPGTGGAPGTGGSTPTTAGSVDCTDTSTATKSVSQQYGGTFISLSNNANKNYYMQANWWGNPANTTATEDISGLGFTLNTPSSLVSSSDNPLGFPSMFIGAYAGHSTSGSNLPKQVSALTSVPTIFDVVEQGTSNYNATYDVWFTSSGSALPSSASGPGTGGAFLMVWLFKPGADSATGAKARQPRGSIVENARSVGSVSGSWNVWYDNSNPPCVSYVSKTPISTLAFDLNDFIKDAITNKYGVTNSQYLSLIFAGFEVWGGGNGLQIKNFCANVK